jgi:hypothetical protein
MRRRELSSTMDAALLPLLPVVLLPPLFSAAAAQPYMMYSCNVTAAGSFASGSAFAANLDRLVAALPLNASLSSSLFAKASVGSGDDDAAYGLALCCGDLAPLPSATCSSCVRAAPPLLRRVPPRRHVLPRPVHGAVLLRLPGPARRTTTPPWSTPWTRTRRRTRGGTRPTPPAAASSCRSWARCSGRWPCTAPTTPRRRAPVRQRRHVHQRRPAHGVRPRTGHSGPGACAVLALLPRDRGAQPAVVRRPGGRPRPRRALQLPVRGVPVLRRHAGRQDRPALQQGGSSSAGAGNDGNRRLPL